MQCETSLVLERGKVTDGELGLRFFTWESETEKNRCSLRLRSGSMRLVLDVGDDGARVRRARGRSREGSDG